MIISKITAIGNDMGNRTWTRKGNTKRLSHGRRGTGQP